MSLQQERLDYAKETVVEHEVSKAQLLYRAVWRWHFYAGIIFAPFIILLAITGIIYLFKPQIENVMYKDYYYVHPALEKLTAEQQIESVKRVYPNALVRRYKPSFEADRSAEVGITGKDGMMTVFVNPYNGKILGDLKDDEEFMNKVRKLHGELMIGTTGDRIVEMASCWAMILLITGLYLWWPRNRKDIFGTFIPRFSKGKRTMLRDLHAVPAFWFSLFVAIFILTGLPWSGLWGDLINRVSTATQSGYPTGLWDGNLPKSTIPSKDVAKVPWAAENLPVPESGQSGVAAPLSVSQIMKVANENKVEKGYSINFPQGEKGVYTVSVSSDKPQGQATLHIDQYSGKVLADLRFADYGVLAKAISIGVALHEGHYFGLANQLLNLIVCLGLIGISVTGVVMWWKRKPSGTLGAPSLPKNFKLIKSAAVLILILGIVFPLVGASLLVVLALDWLVIKRIPAVKQWLG
ncbi:PepSY-associated TM helix domain-containing protein [Bacillus methanolicus]|uniref:Iron-regulated membrane protein n=1 Tax=Bacillus methanolicus (strain MGA3 / ATCC 53907) TaxID=796606 RepID=I3E9C7_BACMM|nr:PepSY domain-containing protein [Bacillus methanolicus]AIE60347.1 iron-regulated membrane protein [Bacillus methanolicus MGA3]EIJ83098.1 iron-regulated membrane protein [Bacillus methanolicus MGA3]